jgi:hypothetical protein
MRKANVISIREQKEKELMKIDEKNIENYSDEEN